MIVGEIHMTISSVYDKWKDIGLKLGLFPNTLEIIGQTADDCLHSMLDKWLQRKDNVCKKGGSTWSTLIQALKSVGADEDILAACTVKANQTSNTIMYTKIIIVN